MNEANEANEAPEPRKRYYRLERRESAESRACKRKKRARIVRFPEEVVAALAESGRIASPKACLRDIEIAVALLYGVRVMTLRERRDELEARQILTLLAALGSVNAAGRDRIACHPIRRPPAIGRE